MCLDLSDFDDLLDHIVENLAAQLRVGHFTTSELQRNLDFVTIREELDNMTNLRVEIALADLRSEFHFLHRNVRCLLSSFSRSLRLLVSKLPVVHDAANGRTCQRSNFHEIEIEFTCEAESFREGFDPQLGAIWSDHTYFTSTNAVIETRFIRRRCYDCSLLCKGLTSQFDG